MVFKAPSGWWGPNGSEMSKDRNPECHWEVTDVVQTRDEGGLEEDGDSSMERKDELEMESTGSGDGSSAECGREWGLEGQVFGHSTWVEDGPFPGLGTIRRGAYFVRTN